MISNKRLFYWLKALHFKKENPNIYVLNVDNNRSKVSISIDIRTNKINYPIPNKNIHRPNVINLNNDENFVELDVIILLLKQGYLPSSIELEHQYPLGHGDSGGRADIIVRDNNEDPFLIIEAKTYGREYHKEWKNMLKNGGTIIFICLARKFCGSFIIIFF